MAARESTLPSSSLPASISSLPASMLPCSKHPQHRPPTLFQPSMRSLTVPQFRLPRPSRPSGQGLLAQHSVCVCVQAATTLKLVFLGPDVGQPDYSQPGAPSIAAGGNDRTGEAAVSVEHCDVPASLTTAQGAPVTMEYHRLCGATPRNLLMVCLCLLRVASPITIRRLRLLQGSTTGCRPSSAPPSLPRTLRSLSTPV